MPDEERRPSRVTAAGQGQRTFSLSLSLQQVAPDLNVKLVALKLLADRQDCDRSRQPASTSSTPCVRSANSRCLPSQASPQPPELPAPPHSPLSLKERQALQTHAAWLLAQDQLHLVDGHADTRLTHDAEVELTHPVADTADALSRELASLLADCAVSLGYSPTTSVASPAHSGTGTPTAARALPPSFGPTVSSMLKAGTLPHAPLPASPVSCENRSASRRPLPGRRKNTRPSASPTVPSPTRPSHPPRPNSQVSLPRPGLPLPNTTNSAPGQSTPSTRGPGYVAGQRSLPGPYNSPPAEATVSHVSAALEASLAARRAAATAAAARLDWAHQAFHERQRVTRKSAEMDFLARDLEADTAHKLQRATMGAMVSELHQSYAGPDFIAPSPEVLPVRPGESCPAWLSAGLDCPSAQVPELRVPRANPYRSSSRTPSPQGSS